jgi:hypothetical protein
MINLTIERIVYVSVVLSLASHKLQESCSTWALFSVYMGLSSSERCLLYHWLVSIRIRTVLHLTLSKENRLYVESLGSN